MRKLIIAAALFATTSIAFASSDEAAMCAGMAVMLPSVQKAYVRAYETMEEGFDTAEQSVSSNQTDVVDELDRQMTDLMSGIAACKKLGYLAE